MATETITRREELLEQVVDYALKHGVSELSLRPLAEALDTSPRMLIYHFGSKEQLVADLMNAIRGRQNAMIEEWRAEGAKDVVEIETRRWGWMTSERMRPLMRLYFESFGLAVQGRSGFEGFLGPVMEEALGQIRDGLRQGGVPEGSVETETTLTLATIRGLMLDVAATGDEARVNAAFDLFVDRLVERLADYTTRSA